MRDGSEMSNRTWEWAARPEAARRDTGAATGARSAALAARPLWTPANARAVVMAAADMLKVNFDTLELPE